MKDNQKIIDLIESQEALIKTQQELITELLNEINEKEWFINELSNNKCSCLIKIS